MSIIIRPRELEVINGLARGLLCKEIAHLMGITEKTIETYLRVSRLRNEAKTTAQLVYMATAAGMVDVNNTKYAKPRLKVAKRRKYRGW